MADSGVRTSSFSHDPMVTANCWLTVCDVLKDRKKHSLFNIHKLRSEHKQSKQLTLVEVVVNVSPEHLVEHL